MKFKSIILGSPVFTFEVPTKIIDTINDVIDKRKLSFPKANEGLAGKIEDEFSLYFKNHHNFLPDFVLDWIDEASDVYIKAISRISPKKKQIHSIWYNDMKQNEYNPAHIHTGELTSGLSSVMFLKMPSTFGKEYSKESFPQNGRLQLLGPLSQFSNSSYMPEQVVGHFLIFPYDMCHIVYPFNSTDEIRRTLSCNIDVITLTPTGK